MSEHEWHVGERLRKAREDRGWSQVELGRRCGINHIVLSRIETKNKKDVNGKTLRKLAQALRVSGDYLLGLKDEMESMMRPAA